MLFLHDANYVLPFTPTEWHPWAFPVVILFTHTVLLGFKLAKPQMMTFTAHTQSETASMPVTTTMHGPSPIPSTLCTASHAVRSATLTPSVLSHNHATVLHVALFHCQVCKAVCSHVSSHGYCCHLAAAHSSTRVECVQGVHARCGGSTLHQSWLLGQVLLAAV